jgi:hypothetical protein
MAYCVNVTTRVEAHCAGEALPEWGFWVGVGMYARPALQPQASAARAHTVDVYTRYRRGVLGSIGINIGQNIQATGLQKLPEFQRAKPCNSRQWVVGLSIFIAFSMLNFAALALAPASILTPLESIQFVTNVRSGFSIPRPLG